MTMQKRSAMSLRKRGCLAGQWQLVRIQSEHLLNDVAADLLLLLCNPSYIFRLSYAQ